MHPPPATTGPPFRARAAGKLAAMATQQATTHDIVTGRRDVGEARNYYAQEFLDARRGQPTPCMEKLRFTPDTAGAADPDDRVLSDEQLEQAVQEGKQQGKA